MARVVLHAPSCLRSIFNGCKKTRFLSMSPSTQATQSQASTHTPKEYSVPTEPFQNIPGPKGLPFIGSLVPFMFTRKNKLHKYISEVSAQYGKLFKVKVGALEMLMVADPADIQQVWSQEGKHPRRNDMRAWVLHRQDSGVPTGIVLSNDTTWKKQRRALSPHMLRPQSVAALTDGLAQIADEFVDHIQMETRKNKDRRLTDLQQSLFLWSFESGFHMLLEDRPNCFKTPSPEVNNFIKALRTMTRTTETMRTLRADVARAIRLPVWKRHTASWDTIFEIGGVFVAKRMDEVRAKVDGGQEVSGFVASLMTQGTMSEAEITCNLAEILAAAIETASITMFWVLYLLSKNPEKQQKLYEEILNEVGARGPVGQQQLRNLNYTKAVLKEALRLYPALHIVTRVMDVDMIVNGFHVPKNTMLAVPLWSVGRDPDTYEDPESFKPERWLREHRQYEKIHPFAKLNFGHGPRSCLGRRFSELEMHLLLSKIIQRFELQDGCPGDSLEPTTRFFLTPQGRDNIVFNLR